MNGWFIGSSEVDAGHSNGIARVNTAISLCLLDVDVGTGFRLDDEELIRCSTECNRICDYSLIGWA
ncbi:hypothetical protein [Candidatus Poriferisodalis sp.]|uniref:hypothetical protein n=1 Tax=Candidatus Poriferisodalis sp. TaxID=3101277 RepID=UPI003B5C0D76